MSEEEVQKVVKLQAHVRGRIVRGQQKQQELQQKQGTPSSSTAAMTPTRRKSLKDPDTLDEEIAVLKIQSAIRGRLARKEAERRRKTVRGTSASS